MINNPENIPSVVETAKLVDCEWSHLSKLFRKLTGMTYNKYAKIRDMYNE